MSDVRKPTIVNPDQDDLLDELKNEIFAQMNCIQIGKIESVNLSEQTVEVQIQFKRRVFEDEIKSYPLLVDVPFIVLQGGGAFLEFPIEKGDTCLVFFNDRNIDDWWDSGSLKEPLTTRKHDLSDGIAFVGLNSKNSALSLDGSKVKLDATGFNLEIKTDKDTTFNDGTDFMVRFNELKTAFDQLITDFDTHTHQATTTATVGLAGPATVTVLPITVGSTANIDTAKIDDIKVPGVGE